jgi:ferredoxin-NADP reductase/MOSC domain-containing protein YiiM
MKLLSVSVGLPRAVPYGDEEIETAIFKTPVEGRVKVLPGGLEGDRQATPRVHGGVDMAVYAYPVDHYAYWEDELGRAGLPHGQFGENLTVSGLTEENVHVGDIFRIGTARLQVTQPRIPCYRLGIRMEEEADFPKRFLLSGRLGFYFRILEEGDLGAGDALVLEDRDEASATMAEFIRISQFESHDAEGLERLLAARDLSEEWRVHLEHMLEKARMVPEPEGWQGYRNFVVERKVAESETITSFYLKPEDGRRLPPYKPGQFLTYRFDIPGHDTPVTRTYTLSDCPRPDHYRLTVKREPAPGDRPDLPPGLGSNYLHDDIEVGSVLCAREPRGEFWLDPEGDTPVVLLSGGVGLTPMISMLNAIVESGNARPTWFIHATRNGREHALGDHVRKLAAERDHVRAHVCYDEPDPGDVQGRDYDTPGRVTLDLLRGLLPDNDADFYICGPTPFMRVHFNGLLDWGVPEARIHYEFFGPESALREAEDEPAPAAAETTPAPAAEAAVDGAQLQVTFSRAGMTVAWDGGTDSLLDLAEAHGLRPDFACRAGICHTCMVDLVEGEVEYTEEILDDPDPGTVLICCCKPKSDVVLDV